MKKKLLLMVSVLAVLFVAAACSSKPEAKINTEPYSDRQTMLGTYVQIRIYDDGKEDVLPKAFAIKSRSTNQVQKLMKSTKKQA